MQINSVQFSSLILIPEPFCIFYEVNLLKLEPVKEKGHTGRYRLCYMFDCYCHM